MDSNPYPADYNAASLTVALRQLVDCKTFENGSLIGPGWYCKGRAAKHLDQPPLRPGRRILDLHAAGFELLADPVGRGEVFGFSRFLSLSQALADPLRQGLIRRFGGGQ